MDRHAARLKPVAASPAPWPHPSYGAVQSFTAALRKAGVPVRPLSRVAGRIVDRTGPPPAALRPQRAVFVPLMGLQSRSLAASSLLGRPAPFAWDVWGSDLPEWQRRLEQFGVRVLFVNATDSLRLLNERDVQFRVAYVAEAIDVDRFTHQPPLAGRRIRVLELGRRHKVWHERVTQHLQRRGITHLYEERPGELVFSSPSALVDGLADSAVSIVFPKSLTHPEAAHGVEVLTQRYLEALASGCVLLGHAPRDLVDLFGYNPVIEVDWSAPTEQLLDILHNLEAHQEQVDRNRLRLLEVGDWSLRSEEMLRIVGDVGSG